MAVVTSIDRLKSVGNRCVIESFGGVFVLSLCYLQFSVGEGGFCHMTESNLFLFLLRVNWSVECQRSSFLYARLQTGRIMVWWCPSGSPSVRPGLRPSVRPSVRPSQFSALFSYMLWHIDLKFCVSLYFYVRKIKFECHQFLSLFARVMLLFNFKLLQICSFPHFSPTCFDIFKFCIWLYFNVPQSKFECRDFASIFVGVMPLCELRILEIHSFPHFSLTCFDILSWNFAYDFVLLYYRSSSSVVNLRQFLWELCPFWNLEYWK